MATPNIVPRADSEGGLGTASKYWASAYIDLIYVGAGSIGRDANNLIDFSGSTSIKFKVNGANELGLEPSALYPTTSDGLSLGYVNFQFSDLFLASGAVINFDGGDVTLTHASNALTLDGGHLQLTTNFEARFGSSNRLRIYSDNTDAYITNTATDGDIIFQADDSSGGVTTYFQLDGGANAMVASKSIYMADNKRFYAGSGGDLGIFHDGTNSALLNDNGDLFVQQNADGKDIRFQCDDGGGNLTDYLTLDGGLGYMVASKAIRALDSVNIQLGSSGAFTMQHNGTNAILQNLTGDLQIISNKQDKDIVFKGDDGQASDNTTATYFYLDGSSAQHNGSATTALYTNWPDKSRITFGTSHDLQISHDGGNSYVENITNDLILINYADDRDIIFKASTGSAAAEEYFRLDGSVGNTYVNKDMRFVDNVLAIFGNDGDMSIKHDGSNMTMINGTGSMNFYQSTDGGDMVFYCDNGSGGLAEYFRLDGDAGYTVASKHINFADNVKSLYGASHDLQIYHDGSHSYISDTGIGSLYINGSTVYLRANQNENAVVCNANGSVDLYHDGSASPKLSTTSVGVGITGSATISQQLSGIGAIDYPLTIASRDDNNSLNQDGNEGVGIKFKIAGNASSNPGDTLVAASIAALRESAADGDSTAGLGFFVTQNDETLDEALRIKSDGKVGVGTASPAYPLDIVGFANSSSGFRVTDGTIDNRISWSSGNVGFFGTISNHSIAFNTNSTVALTIDTSQNATFAGTITADSITTNTGSGAAVLGSHLDLGDNQKARFGASDDLQIYHDGSNSYIKEIGTGNLNIGGTNLYLTNGDGGETFATFVDDGAASIYYDNAVKLATTSTGVDVTGSLTPSLGITQPVASAAANVAAAVAGSIYNFSDADGAVVILPDSGNGSQVGKTFEFAVTTTATSNFHGITCADTANEKIIGHLNMIDTDTSDTQVSFAAQAGDSFSAVSMNGTTTGIAGSRFRLTNISADLWLIEGTILHTGSVATPFAAE